MKTLTRIFAGLAALVAMASCQMYEIDTQMTPEKAAASIRMECSAVDTYTLPATNPESITFNVSANTPWILTLSSSADWLQVTPSSSANGALIADVTVTAQNNSGNDRQATLTLKGENVAQTKIITIKQLRHGRLFVTPVPSDYAAVGGPLQFTIQTNQDWEVRCDQSWISFNRESGAPDPEGRRMTIIATAEPSTVMERFATITITAGDEEESFDVSQKGTFDITEISDSFSAAGEEKTISLRTDLPWTIMADKDWITFDQESGTGDGSKIAIKATAAVNDGAMRKANVKITAGGVDRTFEVSQNGVAFEIVAPASTELERLGGEMVISVNSTLAWEPATEVEGWEVEKIDASSFKVKAAFNNLFQTKTGKVAINGTGGAHDELELTQDVNFTLDGADLQEDGSVKIYGNKHSRIYLKDACRYVALELKFKEVNFDANAELYICSNDAGNNVGLGNGELQLEIKWYDSSKNRLRTNGGATSYNTAALGQDLAFFNALTSCKMEFRPNASDPTKIDLEFFGNGASVKSMTSTSPFATNAEAKGDYYIGTSSGKEGSESYYIIKSCDVTFIAED